ncbi:hypothetical protein T310_5434 [Rasamsonia emersonii CBS 393.64]|uniref:Uncharacterized protein n=1 Tax=Rasamsonia emersonii (strain ATCC 16479 / CBS 393.64 / IMI 116815) TaxID=1408163 RepID=A0A0F4YSC6_RASE3|nr:hypothetical protein T310_5434 [Rasamsonia emersonii CBS 393.64]KKA20538.1 hypothetical protein T310_5434 [Rasamsonia emersonii CBS 393.64]
MSSGIISAGHHDTFRVMFWLLRSPFSQAVKEPVRECIATPGLITDLEIDRGGHPDDVTFSRWKILRILWDPTSNFLPPPYVRLCDAWVYILAKICTPRLRHQRWLNDFNSHGDIRLHRRPLSPTVWLIKDGISYFPVYRSATTRARKYAYVLCGMTRATRGQH